MGEVFIVVKEYPVTVVEKKQEFQAKLRLNEAVFGTEEAAREYISKRKAIKDRDDRGCEFSVEPWCVQ